MSQADAYRVPRIAFLNKMDKPAASLQGSLDSLREKVHAEPLLIQLPLWTGKHFKGVVDLLDLTAWTWDERSAEETWGKEYSVGPVEGAVKDEALEARYFSHVRMYLVPTYHTYSTIVALLVY